MAEHSTQDAVDQAQSVGDPSPSDVSAIKSTDIAARAAVNETSHLSNFENATTEPSIAPSDISVKQNKSPKVVGEDYDTNEVRRNSVSSCPILLISHIGLHKQFGQLSYAA